MEHDSLFRATDAQNTSHKFSHEQTTVTNRGLGDAIRHEPKKKKGKDGLII